MPDSPSIMHSLNDLARIYHAQGKLDEAEQFYKQVLNTIEKNPKSEPTNVIEGLKDFALLLRKTNQDAEAEELERHVEAIEARRDRKKI